MLGAFLSGPIELSVDGVADATSKASDVAPRGEGRRAERRRAAALRRHDQLDRPVATRTTSLPAGLAGRRRRSATLDPAQLSGALGSPADYLIDPQVVGSEDVEGVKAQHVTGQLDAAKISSALQGLASVGGSSRPRLGAGRRHVDGAVEGSCSSPRTR